jgi:hypothetical protein
MNTLRLSLVTSMFALVVSSFALGGCAVDGAPLDPDAPEADGEEVATATQALTLAPINKIDPIKLPIVLPECKAVLVSTGPAVRNEPNTFACAEANPYVGQKRFAGGFETGLTLLLDEAQPGRLSCKVTALHKTVCTRTPDRLVERLCDETRTYECPCGVETVEVEGERVGQCKGV